ncbi:uncharacterized protein PV09_08604 [Verruconis gallopava]|uniref:Uncharacterized protein n=1 Tax=Verruconis gallopava TaxID=253628 RepID=A0A0D1XC28_9PEZI|nr:uncharacterized protein PV09_08604 [Verruconis gallopava]KIV99800.1 hypothetical protein PV09_08604 [Verruconis gallopava]
MRGYELPPAKGSKYDKDAMDEFFYGYEPLQSQDLAECAIYMLKSKDRVAIKALDCVPTAQRALARFDGEWNDRNAARGRVDSLKVLWIRLLYDSKQSGCACIDS